ncbi:MAG: DUF4339 domain-containing protein [Cardiobacteriaceae bacterium]|nr:DUF4339 domain-containing protein [Cardiobacteriaceae bacterium]
MLRHHSQHNLLERSILRVNKGQAVYLIINEQYFPAYSEGEYPLDPDNIPQSETADILFLNLAGSAERLWQSAYQPPQRELSQPLIGSYTISIHDPDAVCQTVIEHQSIHLDDDLIDQWISYSIDHTLIHEHISADDIEYQTEALQNFLKERLKAQLLAHGLTLHDLRIARHTPHHGTRSTARVSRPENHVFAPARENIVPVANKTKHTEETETVRPALDSDKIFYRVHHGEQIGPLSALDIQKLIDEGKILSRDLLWQKGMTAWLPAQAFNLFSWN